MALKNTKWYVNYGNGSSTGYYAVGAWVANTAKSVGALIRATAPTVGDERIFVCVVAGTTHGTTEPTWTITKGGKTDDNDIDWYEITGQPAMNGDVTNTPPWAAAQATAVGYIIANTAGTYYFICTTSSGNTGAGEPTWDTTAGNTTNDGSNVWTCLGAVGGFSAWGAPFARLVAAFTATWGAAGDTFWLSDNHAETQASTMQLTSPGTPADPCYVLCVDDAAAPPTTLAVTATISNTGNFTFGFAACAYFYGITFSAAAGTVQNSLIAMGSTSVDSSLVFDSCYITKANTGASAPLIIGSGNSNRSTEVVLRNTVVTFGNAGQTIYLYNSKFHWLDTPSAIGAAITTLFTSVTQNGSCKAEIYGVDLSGMGTSKNLVNVAGQGCHDFRFINCKLGATAVVANGTHPAPGATLVRVINCDDGDTNYRYQKTVYQGSIYSETTIVRTGGATDGVTPISRKMVTSANSKFFSPLESDPITVWNETVGSEIIITVEVVTDNVTLTNAEAWIEVEHLGTSGYPLSVFDLDSRAADIMATPANQPTSSETWTTTGLGTPVKQYLHSHITPQEKGPIKVRVMLAKASTTMYFCPKVDVSTRQYQVGDMYVNEPSVPVANDVRDGTDYGARGVEYDGDLTLPAAADLRYGVTCGADGTEVTGTLVVPGAASGSLTLAKETGANARGGSGTCAKLTPTSASTYGYWDFFVYVTGNECKLSFYYKSFKDTGDAFNGTVKVSWWDSDNDTESPPPLLNGSDISGTYDDTYRLYESAAKTPAAEGLCRVRIEIIDGTQSGGIYVDDIAITDT